MTALLFVLAFVLAAVDIAAPDLLIKWESPTQDHETLLSWIPLFGGLAISFMGSRSQSDAARRPAKSSSESTRRRLAIAEGAVLVAPLLVLWPFGLVLFTVENHVRMPAFLIGLVLLGVAVGALVALLRLLKIFFDTGGVGLHGAPRALWILTVAGAGLVVVSSLSLVMGVHTIPAGVGVAGLPALVPALHMLVELCSSKVGTIS
jgi:hypothetical protein